MARVVVTGAAGYIGSVVCERLLGDGHDVVGIDSLRHGAGWLYHLCAERRFLFRRADVREVAVLRSELARADVVVPLAAIVGAPACDAAPVAAREVNRDAIYLLAREVSPSQHIVFPATESSYGMTEASTACTEETPLKPGSLYARLKTEAEEVVLGTAGGISLRLATVFGASSCMRFDLLVNHFVSRACAGESLLLFESDFVRSYVHVRDVASCVAFCLENVGRMAGRAYNLAAESETCSKLELAMQIKERFPGIRVRTGGQGEDPDRRNYSVSAARLRTTGFEARRTIQGSLREIEFACTMRAHK